MDKLYLVMPAYNEEANILNVLNDWYPVVASHGNGSKLLILDDGSKDRTYELCCKFAVDHPDCIMLTKVNGGHGAALIDCYTKAVEDGADYIFQTDSDGQTLPEEFDAFWDIRDKYDIIIGHRNKRQDGFSRIVVTKVLKATIRLIFGVSITDVNTPFRLMKANTLKENLTMIPSGYNLTNVLLSVIYKKLGQSMCFIPITFKPRQGGINSINLKRIFKIGLRALKDFRIQKKKLDQKLAKKDK